VTARITLLRNGRVLTQDPAHPEATTLVAVDGRLRWVGDEAGAADALAGLGAPDEVIDAAGRTVLPAFIDPHIHVLATAARLLSVDCSPDAVDSIEDIVTAIRERAAATPAGEWIRAAGYDELALAEKRHPTRHDLDRAAPDHPVRLLHRTGHASVLNSRALALAGIGNETEEPPGAVIDRDLTDGAPNGLLLEMNDLIDRHVPPLDRAALSDAVAAVSDRLWAAGVTCIQDASATNGPSELRLLDDLVADGRLHQTVAAMTGLDHYEDLDVRDYPHLRLGAVKIAPRELDGMLVPDAEALAALIRRVDAAGRQVAVHAVGRAAVDATAAAFAALGSEAVTARRHRVEHAGVCSPETAALLGRLGATVVSQPGFLYWNGDLYSQRLAPADRDDLYPFRRLIEAGVHVAASSDSPVAPFEPLRAIGAAVARRTRSGAVLNPEQRLDMAVALALYTREAARAAGLEHERGVLAPGLAADFVVLSDDPLAPDADWSSIAVDLTVQAGEVVYRR
jgi:predicted amidohydrolase YtcJ